MKDNKYPAAFAAVFIAACGWMCAPEAALAGEILRLGDSAGGVSADGRVVAGSFFDPVSDQARAYRWEAGAMQNLGVVTGAEGSFATEISADGQVVVGQSGARAFRSVVTGGGMVSLGDLPGGSDNSVAWNASGNGAIVVGQSSQTSGFRGFRWTAGTNMTALGDLVGGIDYSDARSVSVDGSTIVGSSIGTEGERAVRWAGANATPINLGVLRPAHDWSVALDISGDGQLIVGTSGGGGEVPENEAFRWTLSEGFIGLGDLPGGLLDSVAGGVSADGSVIVGTGNPGFELPDEPFYWTEADGMRRLWDVAIDAGIDMSAWDSLIIATDVSADGRVVIGVGVMSGGEVAGYRMVLPEPSGLAMIGLFVVATASRRWRGVWERSVCSRRGRSGRTSWRVPR